MEGADYLGSFFEGCSDTASYWPGKSCEDIAAFVVLWENYSKKMRKRVEIARKAVPLQPINSDYACQCIHHTLSLQ